MIHHDKLRLGSKTLRKCIYGFYDFRDHSSKMILAAANQKRVCENGVPDSLNESQCNSMVIVLLRSASVIGPEMVISELFPFNSWVVFFELCHFCMKISRPFSVKTSDKKLPHINIGLEVSEGNPKIGFSC